MDNDIILYKYISFNRFIEMIELERLYLTNITLWEDPFEWYPIIKKFRDENFGQVFQMVDNNLIFSLPHTLSSLYAQSWTYDHEESDAMWRIYSQDKLGVRFAINLKDIITYIKKSISEKFGEDIVVNHYKVKYREEFDVKNYMAANGKKMILTDNNICEFKRSAFEHEKEYRVSCSLPAFKIFMNQEVNDTAELAKKLNNIETPPTIHYKLPLNLLKEVILDPRASKSHEETFLQYCRKRKFEQHKIIFRKSVLY